LKRLLLVHHRTLRVVRRATDGVYRIRNIASAAEAHALLRQLQGNALAMKRLREALEAVEPRLKVAELDDARVLSQAARAVAQRRLLVADQVERYNAPSLLEERVEAAAVQQPAAGPRQERALTWIEIQVVDDASDEPLDWVRMAVRLPSGEENYHTTNAKGLIRIDNIEPGTCDARCDLKGAKLADMLAFVKKGEGQAREGAVAPVGTGTRRIANIEKHKVKKGQSIKSLADAAGLTWQDLAIFNWNTAKPTEINQKLRDEVGCTKKTRDGYNYMFDDSDKPGIVHVPTKWEQTGLATAQRHIFRVRAIRRFPIILENEAGLRIPEAEYEATLADESRRKGTLGLGGVDAIEDPPPGPIVVVYPDHDDVLAKSLAARCRRAFETRKYGDLFLSLMHDGKTLQRAMKAYEKYYNDITGRGLVEDIYHEVTDPEALAPLVGLLAMAEIPTREDAQIINPPEEEPVEEPSPPAGSAQTRETT